MSLIKLVLMIMVIVLGIPIVGLGVIGGAAHHAFLVGVNAYYMFAEWCMYDKKV